MYYRKYFEGMIDAAGNFRQVTINGTTAKVSNYAKQTDIINEAVKETLLAAGIACEYDSETCTLRINGFPLQIISVNQQAYFNIYRYGAASAFELNNSSSFARFSGVNYKFYVTIKGDPQSILSVSIGTYATPNMETLGFRLAGIVDQRNQLRLVGLKSIGTTSNYWLHKEDGTPYGDIESPRFDNSLAVDNVLSQSGSLYPLVDCIDQTGFLKMPNCYRGQYNLGANSFYRIGGDVYFYGNDSILAKCITEIG